MPYKRFNIKQKILDRRIVRMRIKQWRDIWREKEEHYLFKQSKVNNKDLNWFYFNLEKSKYCPSGYNAQLLPRFGPDKMSTPTWTWRQASDVNLMEEPPLRKHTSKPYSHNLNNEEVVTIKSPEMLHQWGHGWRKIAPPRPSQISSPVKLSHVYIRQVLVKVEQPFTNLSSKCCRLKWFVRKWADSWIKICPTLVCS